MKRIALVFALLAASIFTADAQERGRGGRGGGRLSVGVAPVPLPSAPVVFDTAEQHKIRVVVLTKDLSHPWGMTWLPNGDLLVTERPGRLRIVRNGVLDPTPISGLPPMHVRGLAGLFDIALHPKFATNKLIYFSYVKDGERGATTAVARARLGLRSLGEGGGAGRAAR
jgi:glucose/arabinose dehydrogenase